MCQFNRLNKSKSLCVAIILQISIAKIINGFMHQVGKSHCTLPSNGKCQFRFRIISWFTFAKEFKGRRNSATSGLRPEERSSCHFRFRLPVRRRLGVDEVLEVVAVGLDADPAPVVDVLLALVAE